MDAREQSERKNNLASLSLHDPRPHARCADENGALPKILDSLKKIEKISTNPPSL